MSTSIPAHGQTQFVATTVEQLQAAIAAMVQVDVQALQDAVGTVKVALSHQMGHEAQHDTETLSVYHSGSRTMTLLADRFAVGQEAKAFAHELIRWHGRAAALVVMGDAPAVTGLVDKTSRYVVDGTDEYGQFAGDAENYPFVVFDISEQQNIAGPFLTRAEADQALIDIQDGARPYLDTFALTASSMTLGDKVLDHLPRGVDGERMSVAIQHRLAEVVTDGQNAFTAGAKAIDAASERLIALLDANGSLDSETTQLAAYQLRLAVVQALGDTGRIKAAEASLSELRSEMRHDPSALGL